MRKIVAKQIRNITKFDPNGERTYYHFNAEKNAKKIKADKYDPIISDSARQIYQAAKKGFKQGISLLSIQNQLWAAAIEANDGKI